MHPLHIACLNTHRTNLATGTKHLIQNAGMCYTMDQENLLVIFAHAYNLMLLIYQLEEEDKLALFLKRIIHFQQMIRCKGVLLRKDWKIINLLHVSGLQEDGPG